MGCSNSRTGGVKGNATDTPSAPMIPVETVHNGSFNDNNYYVAPSTRNNNTEGGCGAQRGNHVDASEREDGAIAYPCLINPNNPYLRESFAGIPQGRNAQGDARRNKAKVSVTIRTEAVGAATHMAGNITGSIASPSLASPATNYYYRPPTTALTAVSATQSQYFMYAESSVDEIKAPRETEEDAAEKAAMEGAVRREFDDDDDEGEGGGCTRGDGDEEDEECVDSSDCYDEADDTHRCAFGTLSGDIDATITTMLQPQSKEHSRHDEEGAGCNHLSASIGRQQLVSQDSLVGEHSGAKASTHIEAFGTGPCGMHLSSNAPFFNVSRKASRDSIAFVATSNGSPNTCSSRTINNGCKLKRGALSKQNLLRLQKQQGFRQDVHDDAFPSARALHSNHEDTYKAAPRSEADATDIMEDQMHEAGKELIQWQSRRGTMTDLRHSASQGTIVTSGAEFDSHHKITAISAAESGPLGHFTQPLSKSGDIGISNASSTIGGHNGSNNNNTSMTLRMHLNSNSVSAAASPNSNAQHFAFGFFKPPVASCSSAVAGGLSRPFYSISGGGDVSTNHHSTNMPIASMSSAIAPSPFMSRTRHESVQDWLSHINMEEVHNNHYAMCYAGGRTRTTSTIGDGVTCSSRDVSEAPTALVGLAGSYNSMPPYQNKADDGAPMIAVSSSGAGGLGWKGPSDGRRDSTMGLDTDVVVLSPQVRETTMVGSDYIGDRQYINHRSNSTHEEREKEARIAAAVAV